MASSGRTSVHVRVLPSCLALGKRKASGANGAHSATGAWHHHACWPRCDNGGGFDRVGAARCPNVMSSFCFRLPGKTLVRKDMSFKTETSDCQLGWQPRVKKGRGFAQVAFPPLTPKFFLGFTAQVSSTGSTAQNHMFSHIFSHIATELLVDHYRWP